MKHRTWQPVVLVVILLLAAGAITLAVRNRRVAPTAAACPWPVVPSGETPSVASGNAANSIAAPGGGAVSVTETGFTQTDKGQEVSVGATVQNSSALVAYRTRVLFRAYTKDGTSAIAFSARYQYLVEIPILRPGQRAAIGDYLGLDPALANDFLELPPVAKATVEVTQTRWIPAADTATFPTVTARLNPAKVPTDSGGGAFVPALTSSDACHDLAGRGVAAVFRDKAGAIVGGSLDTSRRAEICATGDGEATSGRARGSIPQADLSRTEVSVLCDVTASTYAKPGPDQPVN